MNEARRKDLSRAEASIWGSEANRWGNYVSVDMARNLERENIALREALEKIDALADTTLEAAQAIAETALNLSPRAAQSRPESGQQPGSGR